MVWQEIVTAKNENRRELILSGPAVSNKIVKEGLDEELFQLINLNYLSIHDTKLESLPENVSQLENLQTLVLHSNQLSAVGNALSQLDKLKVLDLSRNRLSELSLDFSKLINLTTLNLSYNNLQDLPTLTNKKLSTLDASNNQLTDFSKICNANMTSLQELNLSHNKISSIPSNVNSLILLKTLDLSHNEINVIPGELSACTKLKDANLKANPIADRRLLKMIDKCHSKQVIDYIKQHCPFSGKQTDNQKTGRKGKTSESIENEDCKNYLHKIIVKGQTQTCYEVVVLEDVKTVRPYFVACVIHDVEFNEQSFKKFIQLQTKLHEGICDKRNSATIATHDANKLENKKLTYTAVLPNQLQIQPLNRSTAMTGAELFSKLQAEADALRKEKKRNVYSGVHKYLYLLEGQSKYPCLLSSNQSVISFPPITNSEISKISVDTKTVFVEVTSSTGMGIAKKVADTLLKEMVFLFGKDLVVEQVRNVDTDGNLKSIYPSRADLIFEDNVGIKIVRE